ncbi:alpha/beta-hydrolase [Lentithecium fluviatile CBS 122367]|uniref:Alpha/beta-hydrolase n=1 Tax=Lentithecium fluviatile CBS 122367 TaxID=1168545 RepID=A0A6G1JDR2_9PLEO|nr:alpha/beta-hydrolase [Lentithecium fluviatile CBS 122367]
MTASAAPSATDIEEIDHSVPARDGASIAVRTYSRRGNREGPVMVMLHGGGWVLGGFDNEALFCRQRAEMLHGVAMNVEYRLAPGFKFPIPIYDCYDAVKWTAAHPRVHGGDLSGGFIVAGVSAGANMAATITHLARDEGMTPPITDCWLSIPSLLSPAVVPYQYKKDYLRMDPLRDEGLIYEKVLLEEYSVSTNLDLYPGLPHGFSSWWPTASFS